MNPCLTDGGLMKVMMMMMMMMSPSESSVRKERRDEEGQSDKQEVGKQVIRNLHHLVSHSSEHLRSSFPSPFLIQILTRTKNQPERQFGIRWTKLKTGAISSLTTRGQPLFPICVDDITETLSVLSESDHLAFLRCSEQSDQSLTHTHS